MKLLSPRMFLYLWINCMYNMKISNSAAFMRHFISIKSSILVELCTLVTCSFSKYFSLQFTIFVFIQGQVKLYQYQTMAQTNPDVETRKQRWQPFLQQKTSRKTGSVWCLLEWLFSSQVLCTETFFPSQIQIKSD